MKVTHLTVYITVLFGMITSCTGDKHNIAVDIEGLGNDTVYVEYFLVSKYGNAEPVEDTLFAVDGKFYYDLPVQEELMLILQPEKLLKRRVGGHPYQADTRFLFLVAGPKEHLKVSGKLRGFDYIDYEVKGSIFASDYARARDTYAKQGIRFDSLEMQLDYYMFSPKAADIPMLQRDSIINEIFAKRSELNAEIRNQKLLYLKNHLDTDLAGYYLLSQPYDTFAVYYGQLTEQVKTGRFAAAFESENLEYQKYLLHKQAEKLIVAGAQAPDFMLKNLAGEDFSLSSQKGKYVVLDFWGSWCGWCIKGFPRMKEYYAKYNSKVEFIGIDCYDKEDDWRKAVKDNEMNWIQVVDESDDITKNISTRYAVSGYPTKIILDKDLKIVEIVVGESDKFYDKLDELLK